MPKTHQLTSIFRINTEMPLTIYEVKDNPTFLRENSLVKVRTYETESKGVCMSENIDGKAFLFLPNQAPYPRFINIETFGSESSERNLDKANDKAISKPK